MTLPISFVAKPPPLSVDDDGVLRVGGTRVRLETVINAFQAGCAAEEILLKYPSLQLTDIYAVITYYLWHRAEVDAYLSERRSLADEDFDFDNDIVRGLLRRLPTPDSVRSASVATFFFSA
jgi:uncharacterized protein (DUF433 family)